MILLLTIIPLAGALTAWLIPSNTRRPLVLPIVACLHLILVLALIAAGPLPSPEAWIKADAVGKLFLLEISVLFAACAFYSVKYLQYRQERNNRVLCMGLLVCLSAMTLATVAHHIGLLWLAIETTTLTMAPLIYFNRNARSIEATWKYMLICSIGIALALLGILFLAYSTIVAGLAPSLLLESLQGHASKLPPVWLNAAFVLMLVGYGTKMGLAPMHTWKPDAYGEAPGLVGAMLAGGLA
ncbi:MAG: hydrogenase, partial [Verrucomicrobia bacterium]|nr:hydrogenase [Deltaproteobacteria bacterium]